MPVLLGELVALSLKSKCRAGKKNRNHRRESWEESNPKPNDISVLTLAEISTNFGG